MTLRGHAKNPSSRVRIGVVILAEFQGDLVVARGHGEMVDRVSPALGLIKGLLVVDGIRNGLAGIGGGAPRCRRVVTPTSGTKGLIRRPSGSRAVHELGPPRVDPDGRGRIGRDRRRGGRTSIEVVIKEIPREHQKRLDRPAFVVIGPAHQQLGAHQVRISVIYILLIASAHHGPNPRRSNEGRGLEPGILGYGQGGQLGIFGAVQVIAIHNGDRSHSREKITGLSGVGLGRGVPEPEIILHGPKWGPASVVLIVRIGRAHRILGNSRAVAPG